MYCFYYILLFNLFFITSCSQEITLYKNFTNHNENTNVIFYDLKTNSDTSSSNSLNSDTSSSNSLNSDTSSSNSRNSDGTNTHSFFGTNS